MNSRTIAASKSADAVRLERVRRLIAQHRPWFVSQGAVVASWRESGGRRLGPYYRLAHRKDGRQRSIYLGKSETLAEQVRQFLAAVQTPLREARAYQRLQASARADMREAKAQLRRQLARFGLRLKGFELRGLETWRHVTRWGQLALQRRIPCPRFMPLLDLADAAFPPPWTNVEGVLPLRSLSRQSTGRRSRRKRVPPYERTACRSGATSAGRVREASRPS